MSNDDFAEVCAKALVGVMAFALGLMLFAWFIVLPTVGLLWLLGYVH